LKVSDSEDEGQQEERLRLTLKGNKARRGRRRRRPIVRGIYFCRNHRTSSAPT
jgi:hypothetical protein